MGLLCMVSCGRRSASCEGEAEEQAAVENIEPRYVYGIAADDYTIDTCRVHAGETLSGILGRHGMSSKQ